MSITHLITHLNRILWLIRMCHADGVIEAPVTILSGRFAAIHEDASNPHHVDDDDVDEAVAEDEAAKEATRRRAVERQRRRELFRGGGSTAPGDIASGGQKETNQKENNQKDNNQKETNRPQKERESTVIVAACSGAMCARGWVREGSGFNSSEGTGGVGGGRSSNLRGNAGMVWREEQKGSGRAEGGESEEREEGASPPLLWRESTRRYVFKGCAIASDEYLEHLARRFNKTLRQVDTVSGWVRVEGGGGRVEGCV